MSVTLRQRNEQLRLVTNPLPGSQPYDNVRPIRIPGRMDRRRLLDCVCELHPPIDRQTWCEWFEQGHIQRYGLPVNPMMQVRGGESFDHIFPNTIEPDVNPDVHILDENDQMIVVNKSAPLPVHASGRFYRNTLISFLQLVYPEEKLRPVHRLDSNTTGIVVIARTADAARDLAQQFESSSVTKRYLVRCHGTPDQNRFYCDAAIGDDRAEAGTRTIDPVAGKHATTEFKIIKTFSDQTTLLEARPITGRTNQIRIHLWHLGFPILGDPSYRPNQTIAASQTLDVTDPPMCLHAASLAIRLPTKKHDLVTYQAPPPDWSLMSQDDFSSFASDSSLEISSSNCCNSEGSSA